ncbi:MAG: UDP-N-acetylmuramoyl-L-alanyl-D-glutamate--2,6-diaminopimelate ligase [Bdellovibrionales bacterium]|nr:UDP-N-acetylmuramoyl-L-alanyl-D-glutamate--2,6-diaminopimelate ligase [Bdellovibrionales bacterium]
MKLAQLLSVYSQLKWGDDPLAEVTSVCRDTRSMKAGSLYVAIRGQALDGHDYISQACAGGAIGLVVENEAKVPLDYRGAVVVVEDSRRALDILASRFFGNPAQNLFCVGVTGTNGKTSTTLLTEAILNRYGWTTGVMGTIDHHVGTHTWETQMTTPDAIDLQRRLSEFNSLGARAAIFEVSSHALSQFRVDAIPFDCVVFTNLTRDHLDYHETMENYFIAKQRLFDEILSRSTKSPVFAIINSNDPYGKKLQLSSRSVNWTYGQGEADFSFQVEKADFSGTSYRLKYLGGVVRIEIPLIGIHNVYNATAAFAVGMAAGAGAETCRTALAGFCGIRGRMERVGDPNSAIHVFVDYAHTDDALRFVLEGLNEIRREGQLPVRIITVFGCGGDRDRGKRPLMMRVALNGSDRVYVTSDNPRSEDPERIISEIISETPKPVLKDKVVVEADRREAIKMAILSAQPGDVVLIAGKGHENYQILNTGQIFFSDTLVAGEFLK